MRREIKFRVRDRKSKQFIGYECLMPDITNDGWAWAKSYNGRDWESGIYYEIFDDSYQQREQFTGLKDKNGKEIYEGDIIRDKVWSGEVKWGDGHWYMFRSTELNKGIGGSDMELNQPYCEHFEVIGNIYENPELFTNQQDLV